MKVWTEAYAHNWGGGVTCGVCGKDHHADCASVRLVVRDDRGEGYIADDLCDACIAGGPVVAAVKLRARANGWEQRAGELRDSAEELEALAEEWKQAAENPGGNWATLEDLKAAARTAKDYLAHEPPPEPKGWEHRHDPNDIPF